MSQAHSLALSRLLLNLGTLCVEPDQPPVTTPRIDQSSRRCAYMRNIVIVSRDLTVTLY